MAKPKDDYRKVKDLTNSEIVNYYKANGIKAVESLCLSMLHCGKAGRFELDFKNNLKGEICESLLECYIIDFIKEHSDKTNGWFYDKGLVIGDKFNTESNFLTEMDLTLFTGYQCIMFECKSYDGDKVITNQCTVNRQGRDSVDVYKQHEGHFKTLIEYIRPYKTTDKKGSSVPPIRISMFDFAEGTTRDDRDIDWKRIMPITNVTNINKFLNLFLDKPILWNLPKLKVCIDKLDVNKTELSKKQVKYVKELHKDD